LKGGGGEINGVRPFDVRGEKRGRELS